MRNIKTIFIAIGFMAAIGFAINVFAHGGMMGWDGGWENAGQGRHHQDYCGMGYDNQMSAEQYKHFEEKREAFFKDTQSLRTGLYDKEGELRNELAKEKPDAAKASELQKEISALQARLDQKYLNHIIEMRKMAPTAGYGFMQGGHMMGDGYHGGYCRQ